MPMIEIVNWEARAKMFERENEKLRAQLISGFYEDEYPHYTQGEPTHELQSLATAEEVNGLVQKLKDKTAEIKKLRHAIQFDTLEHSHECKRCDIVYTPLDGESEDCPKCGHDGT